MALRRIAKGITISGSVIPAEAKITGFEISGHQVEAREVKDLSDATMVKNFEPGVITPGTITVNFENATTPEDFLDAGETGTLTIGGTGDFSATFNVMVTEYESLSAQDKQLTTGSIKYQILRALPTVNSPSPVSGGNRTAPVPASTPNKTDK